MTGSTRSGDEVRKWLKQGVSSVRIRDNARARSFFQMALSLEPDNVPALLWLAWLAPTRHESLALLSRVLDIEPGNEQARAGIRWARKRPETETVESSTIQKPSFLAKIREPLVPVLPVLQTVLPKTGFAVLTLLVTVYLVFWALTLADQAQTGVLVDLVGTTITAFSDTVDYISQRLFGPVEYYTWQRHQVPAGELVWSLLKQSAVLLVLALTISSSVGATLGIVAARSGRTFTKILLSVLSIITISLPSFLLAMILWIINAAVHRHFQVRVLPPTGYGLDWHLVMPVLVLAARPLAQMARVSYVTFSDIFEQDYIRTAVAKGVHPLTILNRHTLRNGLVPLLTTVVTGLRFSLSSLPVVEYFFVWPGLGLVLLKAIQEGNANLTADLVLSLAVIFVFINLLLDVAYRVIDPRAATDQAVPSWKEAPLPLRDRVKAWRRRIQDAWQSRLEDLGRKRQQKPEAQAQTAARPGATLTPAEESAERARMLHQRRARRRATVGNFPLVIGSLLVLAFFVLAIFGENLAPVSPYQLSGVRFFEGEVWAPPFPPSLPLPSSLFDLEGAKTYANGMLHLNQFEFPWGSDPVGRDVMSLVLSGAKRTLALGLFATLGVVSLGVVLGTIAGWGWGGRWDRFLCGLADVLQAFPALLFAMVLILAMDIRKGMMPFVIALTIVGWGEVMKLIRSRAITLRNLPFVESAVATGSDRPQILVRHLFPNLLPTIIPIFALQMATVLLLLAELGFLNIFMGGGAQTEIFVDAGTKYRYSDVPEWGALLSNVRAWWRSYPWMAWYPGLLFAGAILAFNLWGEGLRRLLDNVGFGIGRIFNRYTVVIGAVMILALVWTLRSVAPMGLYSSQTRAFEAQNVITDVSHLSSPVLSGRQSGSEGGQAAAETIAARMKEVGLQPAGNGGSYLQVLKRPMLHLVETPVLSLVNENGEAPIPFTYRQDYAEIAASRDGEVVQGNVFVTLLGLPSGTGGRETYGLDTRQGSQGVLLVTSLQNLDKIQVIPRLGALVVVDDSGWFERRYLLTSETNSQLGRGQPVIGVTPELAEKLLEGSGHTLQQLRDYESGLGPGESATVPLEAQVSMAVKAESRTEEVTNVIGYIPGGRAVEGMDDQVIMIGAYYDGLGVGPDGTFYPGGNDNASGVATILEIARAWQEAPYQPLKTIIFVAWAGGEQYESLSVVEIMNAKTGFATNLEVEAVIELIGVGSGDGDAVLIAEGTSFRLTQLFRSSGRRVGARTTIRGSHAHSGLFQSPPKGGRDALTAIVSWEGSDDLAHTPADSIETLDPAKIEKVGRLVFLAATIMGREEVY